MNLSRLLLSTSCLLSLLFFSGCEYFSQMNSVSYNNEIVTTMNAASTALEATAAVYNDSLPSSISEQVDIDASEMEAFYKDAVGLLDKVEATLDLESRDPEQQAAARSAIQDYLDAAQNYLDTYAIIVSYYDTQAYKDDISQVRTLDESLHGDYTAFIEANNALVEILSGHVDSSE